MEKQQPSNHLAEKDKHIALLKKLLNKQAQEHQQILQSTISYYENILALMPGNVYWVDRNNVYLGCNDIQATVLQLPSRHDIVGKKTVDLIAEEADAIALDEINNRVMETGTAHSVVERVIINSAERVYFSQKVPLRNEQKKIIGLLGISIDITELKKTEEALTIAKELAEAASRAKMEFIANMSHDIRTPLSGVVGMSHLLVERLSHPEHQQFACWINQSGEQLLSLLNSILDVVSAENLSERDIRYEPFDLRQCVDEIIQLERPTVLLKKIDLNLDLDPRIPPYVISDRSKIHRIILNLLGNAIKFTQKGHITIAIKVFDSSHDVVRLRFEVIDTGIGIPLEYQNHVFDRFFRASSSYEGVYSGYGVGLHIAQSYVTLLGGDLNFTSQVGVGTTFYFDLSLSIYSERPVLKEKLADSKLFKAYLEPSIIKKNTKVPHLLLVEDNFIALRMIELIADQAGCLYTSVLSAEEAIKMVKNQSFDLIVTDIGLPGMSGYELTAQIREWESVSQKAAIPIVGLTAHIQVKSQYIDSGMNDLFCKPFNLDMMKSVLSKFLAYEVIQNEPSNFDEVHDRLLNAPLSESQLFDLDEFPLLDIEHAVARIGNKVMLLDMLRLMAMQEIPKDEDALKRAYEISDWSTIEKLAHKMKSGAVYCGTFKMQYACQYLERYARAGHTQLLEHLYRQLCQVLHDTKETILSISINRFEGSSG